MKQFLTLAIVMLLLASCTASQTHPTSTPDAEVLLADTPLADMPNPASVYCQEHGYRSEIHTMEDGSQYGVCSFTDGSECDEWAYYRGECSPEGQNSGPPTPTGIPILEVVLTDTPLADMPNPATVFCQEQGYQSEIRTLEDSGQYGVCLFPDGSECDEWAYFRGECSPAGQNGNTSAPVGFPTAFPIDPAQYQGWWSYTHTDYGFSIMLPEDWHVEEIAPDDPLLGGHLLNIYPQVAASQENIRMTFRRIGEETLLWPTGVGQGDFIPQGMLEIAGQPAQRVLLVCPNGEITAIWYHEADGQPSITRSDVEFGFIYSSGSHCEPGFSLSGEEQLMGEMIIASLKLP